MKNTMGGIMAVCLNPACKHKWIYRGHSKVIVNCPMCRKVVRLEKKEVAA